MENLIKPIFIYLLFVRSEREGEWSLHLAAVKSIPLYFYGAEHYNFFRYGSFYLHNMNSLPKEVLDKFMMENHVMRYKEGYGNSKWSFMCMETTFIHHGKGPVGIAGVTLKPGVPKKWADSLHICTQILKDLDQMRDRETSCRLDYHKEEIKGCLNSDEKYRAGIQNTLEKCINPLCMGL